MEKLLLVDGHGSLFRMFFGMPNKIFNKRGNMIQGTIGFIGGLLRVINQVKPTHALVIFDSDEGSFRDKNDESYKASRLRDFSDVPDDVNPFTQLPDIQNVLNYMQLPFCEIGGIEADDVMATYAKIVDVPTVIMTNDTDMLQLVDDRVKVYDYRGKNNIIIYCPNEVEKRFGVNPYQIPDYKALTGDKSDNIKGVQGVGKITAIKLLNSFCDVTELLENLPKVKPESLQKKLLESKSLIIKNLSLTQLTNEVNLPICFSDLRLKENIYDYRTVALLKDAQVYD